MEKPVKPYDMECMKLAILKHEETFKQQVYELHRLYQIQRMMMKNMQRSIENQKTWSLKNGIMCFEYQSDYTFNNFTKQDLVEENGSLEIEDESEIELTLGPTSYTRRENKPTFATELNSDSIASFSSSSTDSRVTVEDSRVLRVEDQMRQVDRSLNNPSSWVHQIII